MAGKSPPLRVTSSEVEDILLLCYANYFGDPNKTLPLFSKSPKNQLAHDYLCYLKFMEWKDRRNFVTFESHCDISPMIGPKRVYRNHHVNLQKWGRMENLTGTNPHQYNLSSLIEVRERNWRVLTIVSFFDLKNVIPTLYQVYEALELLMEERLLQGL